MPKDCNGYGLDAHILARVAAGGGGVTFEPPVTPGASWRLRFEDGNLAGVILPRWMRLAEEAALDAIARAAS